MGLTAQEVRQLVSHPIIDSDGHLLESTSLLTDFLADLVGGKRAKQILLEAANQVSMGNATTGRPRTGWWLTPNNARDIATAMAPGFRVERAGELGIDFSILYPSAGLVFASLPEEEARLAGVRAINNMHAELCRDYSRHLTPAALIPMHTPHEAVAELVHARSKLGMKVAMIPPIVARAVPPTVRPSLRHTLWTPTGPTVPMTTMRYGPNSRSLAWPLLRTAASPSAFPSAEHRRRATFLITSAVTPFSRTIFASRWC